MSKLTDKALELADSGSEIGRERGLALAAIAQAEALEHIARMMEDFLKWNYGRPSMRPDEKVPV